MKVGILTFHSSYNFGANLQTLATQQAVRRSGHEVEIVNFQEKKKMEEYRKTTRPEQAHLHEEFAKKYLNVGRLLTCDEEIETYCVENLDAVLVGSDQVLRIKPQFDLRKRLSELIHGRILVADEVTRRPPAYWLNWAGHGKRIYRATISGSASGAKFYAIPPGLWRDLARCVSRFDYLSVRDDWTKFMLWCLSGCRKTPTHCPDPVFSLRMNFDVPPEEAAPADLSKAILLSGEYEMSFVKGLMTRAHREGLSVVSLPDPDREFAYSGADGVLHLPLSPLCWFSSLGTAAGYVGPRYHAMVTCMASGTRCVSIDKVPRVGFSYVVRSRSRDLCRKAGTLGWYFKQSDLRVKGPDAVFDALVDRDTLSRAKAYAQQAKESFLGIVADIVARAEEAVKSQQPTSTLPKG